MDEPNASTPEKKPNESGEETRANLQPPSAASCSSNRNSGTDEVDISGSAYLGAALLHGDNPGEARRSWDFASSSAAVPSGASGVSNPTRWELDLFLHTLYNVNDTLRLQLTIAGGLMAACITMMNVLTPNQPRTQILGFINEIDRFVFIPALISMAISYVGLEHHWNYDRKKAAPPEQMQELYSMVAFKYRALHVATAFLVASAILLSGFVLIEFG